MRNLRRTTRARSLSLALAPLFLLAVVTAVGCGDSGGDDGGADVVAGTAGTPDSGADVAAGPDTAAPDVGPDAALADVAPACEEGAWRCSDDGYVLSLCEAGEWTETDCMRTAGQLCEEGACVDPWRWGAPQWGTCPDEPLATPESLAEKAAYYDEISTRLHIHPELGWMMNVTLPRQEVPCPEGGGMCEVPVVAETEATWEDVERWHHGENDGLWNGLYIASQAYRYGATRSDEALANIRLVLAAEVDRMRVTGVPGIFTRELVPPGVDGISCPTNDASYTTDLEKDDNRWVQIREDGCVWVIDRETGEWTGSDHCGLDDYVGYCWLDNVSQDEYAGHMFALAALAKLVDDPDVQETVRDLVEQVGQHLYDNDMALVDWDGRLVEHGRIYPTSLTDAPGFSAVMGLDYILMAAEITGREDFRTFYDDCLLQKSGKQKCLQWPLEEGRSFASPMYLDGLSAWLYPGPDECAANYNNFSMIIASFHDLLWFERDPEVRDVIAKAFDEQVVRPEGKRVAVNKQGNAWYNFMWAAQKKLGPDSDGPDFAAVEDGVCALRQFAAHQTIPTRRPSETNPHYCDDRLDHSAAEFPIPVAERCPSTFFWWKSPYRINDCSERAWEVNGPADYLLAYWMGRYYGFISEDM